MVTASRRTIPRVRSLGVGVLVLFLACTSNSETPVPTRPALSLASGDASLKVDLDRREVTLSRGGTTLLRLPSDAFDLGTREVVDDKGNYDPWPIYYPSGLHPTPEDLVWLTPERFDLAASSGSAVDVDVTYASGAKARVHFEVAAAGTFAAKITPSSGGGGTSLAYVRLRARTDATEGFYGLGEYFDDVNQRGHVRAMQIEIDAELEGNYNEAHVPIPFLIGTRGWGLFVDSRHPAVFAVANEENDRVDAVFGMGTATTAGLSFHLFTAAHPLDLTKHYYERTGYPMLPARWALGPWIWRDENDDQAQVESDIAKIRELDLATTAIWIDRPYATGVNTFDFKASQFPDPKAMIATAHDAGLRVALWHTPYLDEKDASTEALRAEAKAKGYYPKSTGIPLNGWGLPIDLTKPEAYAWWQSLIRRYTDEATGLGIEGFKLDYGEDVVPGITKSRNVWSFADGSDERTMHAGFTHFYHRVYAETLPAEGGFLLCRRGAVGDQKYTSVIWPGDLDADFSKHREVVVEADGKKHTAVGGLPASVVAGLTLGPSGYPFFGADTGGYRHSPPNKEVFIRWFEQTALSTVMQVGNSASTVPWDGDAETLDAYRRYARLHLRLFPYEWTYAKNLVKDGRPIERALGLAHPELSVHPNDEYLFGDHLLVAPVVENGKRARSVLFPKGKWTHWWTGQVFSEGTSNVEAPLDSLPLFLAEGGTVPMLRPTIDAMAATTKADVDSFATTAGVLWVRVAPAAPATFVLYDGATIGHRREGAKVTLSSKDGSEFANGVVFELVATKKPSSTTGGAEVADDTVLEAATAGWTWTADAGGTLHVKVPAGTQTVEVRFDP